MRSNIKSKRWEILKEFLQEKISELFRVSLRQNSYFSTISSRSIWIYNFMYVFILPYTRIRILYSENLRAQIQHRVHNGRRVHNIQFHHVTPVTPNTSLPSAIHPAVPNILKPPNQLQTLQPYPQLQRQLTERGGISLSDQESLVSFPRGSVNGAATPGAGSSTGILAHLGSSSTSSQSQQQQQQQLQQQQPSHAGSASELVVVGSAVPLTAGGCTTGQAGDRGSCSADSGVRGSSDRESGGATSIGGNLSDSTTDGEFFGDVLLTMDFLIPLRV